jgi:transcriptional regulator with XRE-family HTH domain
MNIIYGLRDPRNDVYQYIGKSTVGKERALKHLTKSHSDRVNQWVSMLKNNWLYPSVDIIEEVENVDDLSDREDYWISYYKEINPYLLNIQLPDKKINNVRSDEDEAEYEFMLKVLFKIPEILKRERVYRRITQDEMAKNMKVSRSTLSLCERNANVTFEVIQKYFVSLKGIDILTKSNNSIRVRNKKIHKPQ